MSEASDPRPNVLMIVADQQRYDCIGYAGMMPVRTPNLDALAEQGCWFEHAYTSTPTCCPARQSLLSGQTAESIGAYWNYDVVMPTATLTPDTPTWPQALAAAGYNMAFIGKWHVSPSHGPLDFGYHYYYGIREYDTYYAEVCPACTFERGALGESDPVPLEESRTHVFADKAIAHMRRFQESENPWHIRLDFPEPHPPYRPAAPFDSMYENRDVVKWGSFAETFEKKPYIQRQQLATWGIEDMEWEDWAPTVARYYAVISQYDDAVGRVLAELDQLGARENTIIIYTADHGDMAGGHRMMDKHYVMYDDVVRVPLTIAGPGIVLGVRQAFVSNTLDLPPTIMELTGLEPRADMHGCSLMPLLRGRTPAAWPKAAVSTYNGAQFGLFSQRMIRTQSWKLVWNLTDIDELYDLRTDPYELVNRIDDPECVSVRRSLKRQLYTRLREWGDPLSEGPWVAPQLLEQGTILSLEIPPTV